MITDEHVRIERDGHVVTVTLDRPGTRNACSMNMWLAIRDALRDVAGSDARCVILTGANGDFCSGADIVKKPGGTDPGWEGNRLTAMRQLAESVVAVHDCPVPVIAKVDGVAVGAGFGLALAADMLWCSDRARMSAVFAKLGLSLDYGSSWLLAKRLGLHRAKEVALTAEMMDAARIEQVGLANAVVPADELDAVVAGVAKRIADGPPMALSMTKRMLDNAATSSLIQALETEAIAQNVNLGTADLAEALAAFAEKRAPVFEGR
ncbi:MAG TPA: enoyl-CoA hydratase-related protein [Acidimicrobiales bacterium]|nr:enoyl-CoA hydratase-related protein [Acidimicrobiales bacterium]